MQGIGMIIYQLGVEVSADAGSYVKDSSYEMNWRS